MAKKDLFQGLIDIGKEHGYLTYEEINKSIPQKSMVAEKIDSFFVTLDDLGIKVIDNKEYLSDKAQKNQGEAVEQTVKAASDDEDINPVRMYLSEMAKVPLLERSVEVELAKNIRENEKKL
jgi:RNA polymerase primary sigma factor